MSTLTATHTHRKSAVAWRIQYGNAAGIGDASQNAFHGRCDVSGAHVRVAVCACGASLLVCPANGGNRPEQRKWVGGEHAS